MFLITVLHTGITLTSIPLSPRMWRRLCCYKEKIRRILSFHCTKPTAIGGMSRTELDAELTKGVESLKSGRTYTADEVDAEPAREFGI